MREEDCGTLKVHLRGRQPIPRKLIITRFSMRAMRAFKPSLELTIGNKRKLSEGGGGGHLALFTCIECSLEIKFSHISLQLNVYRRPTIICSSQQHNAKNAAKSQVF